MPKVIRQSPSNGVSKKPIPSASVLSLAMPVSEVTDTYYKVCIYGRNRVGKTTLACQFPKPLLILSFEPASSGGAASVKNMAGVEIIHLRDAETARQVVTALGHPEFVTGGGTRVGEIKSIVVDTATSLQEVCLEEATGRPAAAQQRFGEISRDDYMSRSEKTKEIMKGILELPTHTVVLSQEKDANKYKEGLEPFFASDLGDSPGRWVYDKCDYYLQLLLAPEVLREVKHVPGVEDGKKVTVEKVFERDTGRKLRRLRLKLHENYAAGGRFPSGDDGDAVPDCVEGRSPKELYEALMDVIEGK